MLVRKANREDPDQTASSEARLAIDRSISILPVAITAFNRSLLVDWSIEKNMVDVKILSISYSNLTLLKT